MTEDVAAGTDRAWSRLRNAVWTSVALQVVIVGASLLAPSYYLARIALLAVAAYWLGVIVAVLRMRHEKNATAADIALLRWGYLCVYGLLTIAYFVMGELGWK